MLNTRPVEDAFSEALTQIDMGEMGAPLTPTVDMDEVQRLRADIIGSEELSGEEPDALSKAIELCCSIAESLTGKSVGDIRPAQQAVIKQTYRFVTGPVQELAAQHDPETGVSFSRATAERVSAETEILEERLRENGLLKQKQSTTR